MRRNKKRILKNKIIVSILLTICLIASAFPTMLSVAAPTEKQKVKVGYYENEIFEEGAREGAVKSGYAYEYYRKLSEYTGWDYEYVYGDFDELYEKLLRGEIDFLAGLAKTPERQGIIGYPDTPMGNENYILIKHESDKSISSDPAGMNGKTVGVLKSSIEGLLKEYLTANNIQCNVMAFDSYDDLYNAFDEGRIDILAGEGDGVYNRKNSEVLSVFGKRDYYLCVAGSRDDLLSELNDTILQIQSDEPAFFTTLQNKYYSSGYSGRIYSAEEKEWINTHDSLRVGYLNNYLPYSDTASDGNVTGIVKDIVPAILDELKLSDIKVSYKGYNKYEDMVRDVVAGNIDVAFPVGGGLYYSEENGIYQSSPVVSASTDLVYKGEYLEDDKWHFAVNENNKMQYYYIITNFPGAEITTYPSIDDCLEAVLDGKVTATTLNGLRANDILKNRKYSGLFLRQLPDPDERSFGIAIGNEGLLRLINRGISLVGSDYIQKVAYSYAGELYSYSALDVLGEYLPLLLVIIIVIILIIVVLVVRDWIRQKKANQLKTDFLSNMSHEIRTPITAILGMNEMIQMETDDEDILSYSDNIDKAGNNLLGIINDILDISKIESGNIEVYEEEYNIADMLSEIYAMASQSAYRKGLELIVIVDKNLPGGLMGDVKKLRQIIMNLLSNAVKYTNEGHVKLDINLISMENASAEIEVSVTDTGIGIKDEDKKRLFKEFDRLDLEKNNHIEGTGLGLAISQKMLAMLGSHIEFESTYGKGSKFFFKVVQKVTYESPIGEFKVSDAKDREAVGKSKTKLVEFSDAKVLVVDDTPMNLSVISGLLKNSGLTIETAKNGEECIKKFEQGDYDLILLDQRMPVMDGITTLTELKKKFPDRMKTTPVIALTANVLSGSKETMLKAGFDDYLGKPVKRDDLEKVLLKFLKEKEDSPAMSNLKKIDGIDIEKGLAYCGDEEDYLYALELYADSVDDKIKELEGYIEGDNLKDFAVTIHSLKTTSLSIGAVELSDKAKALEKAADNSDTDFVRRNIKAFTTDYREIGKLIKEALL